jgi:TATA-binding protein-associated factor Taf7
MSNSKEIIDALLKEDLFKAKKLIHENLVSKMGTALEEKLVDFAPTIFNEGAKPDFLDLDKDGNKKEPMKKAAKEEKNESVESDDDDVLAEEFEAQLKSLVEEIQEETGEELTEEEIMELAHELLDIISEESKEDQEDEETEEEDDNDTPAKTQTPNLAAGRMNNASEAY